MSVNGTYSFAYCGELGVGAGIFAVQNNVLTGADVGRGKYHGTVSENPDTKGVHVVFGLFLPAGSFLVQGTSPQEISQTRSNISVDFPPDFDNGEPIKLFVPPGTLTVMIRRIPDDYAHYASANLHVVPTPD